jgi:hypothetical protein
VIGLIIILFIPFLCKQKRLSALFGGRKENIDGNYLIKNHYGITRDVSSSQSNASNTE